MSSYNSSVPTQFLNLPSHHTQYPAIDPGTTLKGAASGKTIFLSGASRGIGQATAVAFAQAGASAIYTTARSAEGLKETKAKIAAANPHTQCSGMLCDVTNAAQVKAAVDDCISQFGGIDVADANAGYLDHGEDGIKCFAVHPGSVPTTLAKNMPEAIHANLVDSPELAAGFIVWLSSGKADWAKGRYLSSNWDVDELMQLKDKILEEDLFVTRLRIKS